MAVPKTCCNLGYEISGRLFPTTNSINDSQTASQCFAAGLFLDSFPFDDSEWYSYTHAKDLEVHSKVAGFLKVETLGIEDARDTIGSKEDDFLECFQSQITYHDGTYFVPLPKLDNHPPLPSNFNLAHSHLQEVKKRLLKLDLWKLYASIIVDQLDKGYVEAVFLPVKIPWVEWCSLSQTLLHFMSKEWNGTHLSCCQCRPCLSERLFIYQSLPPQVIEHHHSSLQS